MLKREWLLMFVMFVGATLAQGASYQVGTCLQGVKSYTTIQAAVSGVPPGSTILICPGIYSEQVTISQPLTLRGVAANNQDRPTITIPPGDPAIGGGLQVNATSFNGYNFAAQVLVRNVNPSGNVTIINLTVDGAGAALSCNTGGGVGDVHLAGIFFASGTSGAIQASAVRNQKGQVQAGCGYGIWLENASGVSETIEAANVSVHDFDTVGINAVSPQNPPTLSVNFQNNAVHSTGDTVGIDAEGVIGTVARNVVTGGSVAIFDFESQPNTPGLNVSGNRVAGSKVGIVLREGSTASNNQISNTQTALSLNAKPVSSSLTITANTIKNAAVAVDYNCASSVFFASNTINDAAIAYNHPPSALIITAHPLVNPIYNVDAITAGSCP